jgi:hypothetical protein
VIVSCLARDSFTEFLTLKYTVFVPLPEDSVKDGDVEYVSHDAPLKLDDSLAM